MNSYLFDKLASVPGISSGFLEKPLKKKILIFSQCYPLGTSEFP